MKVGIFGGSFDPIHSGHIAIIKSMCSTFDKVIVVPTTMRHYKDTADYMFTFSARCNFIIEACKNILDESEYKKITVSDIEKNIDRAEWCSAELIKTLKSGYSIFDEICFVIGADSYNNIKSWRHYTELIANCTLYVVKRPGDNIQDIGIEYCLLNLSELSDKSSTMLRKDITDLVIGDAMRG